ncbi:ABC transporter ATP-binding protein [Hymenobacter aquaticus]|uniref:ABC transporter ATP-binding protein n=1 Tax=Hymenobacter aquaticus TaxID=1867101 RepID=A0A4Z0Q661_9BACT|nr:ATP-binding cassette domain-containing protein [Hymenobacter aquaticus]TGE24643.1 ABC transporter ATP-binding protein [Hymenobacter aquaticus]
MLSIRNLGKSYGSQPVLRHVDLDLRPGTIHGLVGANGAGKTTLLHCLYGLLTDYTGQIRETTGLAIREHTGVLPYEPYFYPRLTGREYLEFSLQARRRPLIDFSAWNTLLELPLDHYAEEYSAGMKKKLALLGLLVQDFRYLILDEPFNGLDMGTNLLLKEILLRLRAQGRGILLTSHLLGTLTETCDEITLLAGGTVQRHYSAAQFPDLTADLLDVHYQDKLAQVARLLP